MIFERKFRMRYPPVVIILCTYNGEKYIKEQLDTILEQTYPNIILSVYDDGSRDRTLEIIERIKRERQIDDERLTVHINEKPTGSACANFMQAIKRNQDAAYIALCDQDDLWLPNKIEAMMNCALENDQQGTVPFLVCHGAERIDASGEPIGTIHIPELNFFRLVQHPTVQGSCMLFNRKCTELICFDADRIAMHDWYISLVYSLENRIHVIDQPLMKYRIHENNVNGHRGTGLLTRAKWLVADQEKVAFRKESLEQLYEVSRHYDNPFLAEYREAFEKKDEKEIVLLLERYHCLDSGIRSVIQKRENRKAFRLIQTEKTLNHKGLS